MRPVVGRSRPPSRASRVDFPQPEGPVMATNSPGATSKETPSSAVSESGIWVGVVGTGAPGRVGAGRGRREPPGCRPGPGGAGGRGAGGRGAALPAPGRKAGGRGPDGGRPSPGGADSPLPEGGTSARGGATGEAPGARVPGGAGGRGSPPGLGPAGAPGGAPPPGPGRVAGGTGAGR